MLETAMANATPKSIKFNFDPCEEFARAHLQLQNESFAKTLKVEPMSKSEIDTIFNTAHELKTGAYPDFKGFTYSSNHGKANITFNYS